MRAGLVATLRRGARVIAGVGIVAGPALAGAQVLTFEGLSTFPGNTSTVPIGNFYNGGSGPNYGVEFSPNALAICFNTSTRVCSNTSRGGRGDPNSQGAGLNFLSGSSAFMNRAAGFTTGFSFFYSAINRVGAFSVFDGLNGTGNLLASLALPLTTTGPGPCYSAGFCPFVAAGVSFDGTARSVVFSGVQDQISFDDVTFGNATPGMPTTTAPEPGTWALVAGGLAGLGAVARRRRS